METVFFDNLFSKFSIDIGIDLGTANTPLIVKDKGVKLKEPSFIARDKKKNKVIAVGVEAKLMFERNPKNIEVIKPLKHGVIVDFDAVRAMLSYFITKLNSHRIFKPRLIIGVPLDATEVEKKSVIEAARLAGARSVYVVEQPLAGAVGIGLPVGEPVASAVVDIGAGAVQVAVISLGGIVASKISKIAGEDMDTAIIEELKRSRNILIGERTAEDIKIYIGQAMDSPDKETLQVKGRDLSSGMPAIVDVDSTQIYNAIKPIIMNIGNLLRQTLEDTPPELTVDIIENGIALIGGIAQIKFLDKFLSKITGVKCYVPNNPQLCAVSGMNKLFSSQALMQRVFRTNRYLYK
jgi:rod shape-determining protein MreB